MTQMPDWEDQDELEDYDDDDGWGDCGPWCTICHPELEDDEEDED